MKKMLAVIIALLVIIIAIIGIVAYKYFHGNVLDGRNTIYQEVGNVSNLNIENNKETTNEAPTGYGPNDDTHEITSNELFLGHTEKEWIGMISAFYGNYYGNVPKNIECHYNQEGKYVATLGSDYDVSAEFTFDSETGFATESYTNMVVDFENGKVIEKRTEANVNFTDNLCLAIGYVLDKDVAEFRDKYFFNDVDYNSLPVYDYRDRSQRVDGYGNRFVIIPKTNEVNISVYDCFVNGDGEIELDNTLISSINKPFIIYDDYIEYTPKMCIKLSYNGFEETIPIQFSGENGHLVLAGYESEVLDISLYSAND